MGTNYYLIINPCAHCGRGESRLHIGKSSAGWCFSLHVDSSEGLNSLEDWQARWAGGRIEDEYGNTVAPGDMLSIVADRSHPVAWEHKKLNFQGYSSEAEFHRLNHSIRGPNNLFRHQIDERCIGYENGTWDLIIGEFS